MDRKITIWCIGVLVALFSFQIESVNSTVKPEPNVFYYLKIDTGDVDLGYLYMEGESLVVRKTKGDSAMWRLGVREDDREFYLLVNKVSNDTLRFAPPVINDTIATYNREGILEFWGQLTFNVGESNDFKTSWKDEVSLEVFYFCLTMSNDGVVSLSSATSGGVIYSENYSKLNFVIERPIVLPDDRFYRIVVDTLGYPDINDYKTPWKVLSADTSVVTRRDSLAVTDTVTHEDLSFWKFKVHSVVSDTTFFEIRNKATDSLLIFDVPANGIDTVAYIENSGAIKQWKMPFFIEDGGTGNLMVRDTITNKDYYLGYNDTIVMLTTDTFDIKCLKFAIAYENFKPYIPDSSIVDSTKIYKIKYLNGTDSGKYLGADVLGARALLDSVYSHIPDGQFVIFQGNKYSFMNRAGNIGTDSVFIVRDDLGNTIPNVYTNHRIPKDTFEITPITYGNIDAHKINPGLGYKYATPTELSQSSFAFSYTSVDTLNSFVLGYNPVDSLMILLAQDDTMQFIMESLPIVPAGAPAIAGIPQLQKAAYYLRSLEDEDLYVSIKSDTLAMDETPNTVAFFLKEDSIGGYYFVENSTDIRKVMVDSTRLIYLAPKDTIVTHHFAIIQKDRNTGPPEEPDDFIYLKEFPDNKGRGYYEFRIIDPASLDNKWLTKNFSDYAVLGKEGESILRAGSYIPSDLHLWVDTARGKGFNPDKASFYIMKDVDTTELRSSDNYRIAKGYFLHVMDSASLGVDDYVYDDKAGNIYNRANFVKAKRDSADVLLLNYEADTRQANDSVGFAGKNEDAINEYRFYLQETGSAGKYYIVTEAGYGDGGLTNVRGYLSVSATDGRIYFGPRGSNAAMVEFTGSTVSNEIVRPPAVIEEVNKSVSIIGGSGQVAIHNAMGQDVVVYNVLGQAVVKKVLLSDNESVPASRGIVIVKVGTKTQKVVVK